MFYFPVLNIFVNENITELEIRGGTHLLITSDPDSELIPSSFDLMADDIASAIKNLLNCYLRR